MNSEINTSEVDEQLEILRRRIDRAMKDAQNQNNSVFIDHMESLKEQYQMVHGAWSFVALEIDSPELLQAFESMLECLVRVELEDDSLDEEE